VNRVPDPTEQWPPSSTICIVAQHHIIGIEEGTRSISSVWANLPLSQALTVLFHNLSVDLDTIFISHVLRAHSLPRHEDEVEATKAALRRLNFVLANYYPPEEYMRFRQSLDRERQRLEALDESKEDEPSPPTADAAADTVTATVSPEDHHNDMDTAPIWNYGARKTLGLSRWGHARRRVTD